MKPERVVELLERLVDEKISLHAILSSKTLGEKKRFFSDGAYNKVAKIKEELIEALNHPGG